MLGNQHYPLPNDISSNNSGETTVVLERVCGPGAANNGVFGIAPRSVDQSGSGFPRMILE